MFSIRKLLLSVSFLCFVSTPFAQTHLAKTLLWRISGKGLQKPSYLFGTMHLTDKRLFNFTDSVYHAIENTQGLAIEVNPDEMMAYVINKAFDEMQNGKKVKDMLAAGDYKKYAASLSKKFGKPADEITTHDVAKEKNKWVTEYLAKGEMPTFVDAYLYNIAKKQGKWIGGIEDITDQAGLMEDMVDKSDITYMLADDKNIQQGNDNTLEKLIDTYTSQDIENIEVFTNATSTAESKDRMLISRNIKMARRIDSLSVFRTMFFAIGAAHLPGDSGVIRLLQARGFTVEPVMSVKKIAPADYKVKEVEPQWTEFTDEQGLYKASMPGTPLSLKLYGLVNMKFMFDLNNFSGFCTMAVINSRNLKDDDSTYDQLAKRMFQTAKFVKPKKITKDGITGREYIQVVDNMVMRLQLYAGSKALYIALGYALKKEAVSSPLVEKFFNSFSINTSYASTVKASLFTDSVMGISFNTPATLSINQKLSKANDNGWKITTYSGSDVATGAYVMLFSKEVMAGSYLANDTAINARFFSMLQSQYNNVRVHDTVVQGININMAEGESIKEHVHVKAFNTIAGNRNILLLVLGDSAQMESPVVKDVFNSFRFIEGPAIPWQQYSAAGGAVSAWAPSAFFNYPLTDENKALYVSYDTTTATSYMITTDTLGKYTWANSDSVFIRGKLDAYFSYDSLLYEKRVQDNGLNGTEFLVKRAEAENVYARVRYVVNDNIVYKLTLNGSKALLQNDKANKFFASLTIAAPHKDGFLVQRKSSLLLSNLASADSTERFKAYTALNNAPFSQQDLPLLHGALFRAYAPLYDDDSDTYINERIGESIAKIGDASTIAFIQEKYKSFADDNSRDKNIALSVLSGIHAKESYDVFAKMLTQSPPRKNLAYSVEGNLRDSLALTAGIYPDLLPFAKDTVHVLAIANITKRLIDSSYIKIEALKVAENSFTASAMALLPGVKMLKSEDVDYDIYNLMYVLDTLNTPGANDVMKSYLETQDMDLRNEIVSRLLKHNQAVPAATITGLAANIATRTDLYHSLKALNKTSLFPAQYLTQQSFAQALVYSAATDDEDEGGGPEAATFLSKKTAAYKGKSYTFYLFKVTFGQGKDVTSYLGIAGGYKPGSTLIDVAEDISGLYWKEEYDAGKVSTYFNAYLENLTKQEEGSGDEESH